MRMLLIINPVSGGSSNDKAILRIHELAVEKACDFKFIYTTGENDDEAIQKELTDYKPDRVIAGGGDGTIQLVVRNLMHKKIPIGILPLGSANGLSTALDLARNTNDAVEGIFDFTRTQPLDVLRINGKHLCIHLSDIGINATIVKNYEEGNNRGMMGYAKYLVPAIKEAPLLHYTITTPEDVYKKEGYMLAIANGNKYGTGVQISDGSVSDGNFEICNVDNITLDAIIKAGLTIFNIFVDKDMFSDVIRCKQAEITIDQKTDFQIDGEYIGLVDHIKVEVIASAVDILVS